MIIDRYTKAILTLIAVGLFVVSLNPWVAPTKAYAALAALDNSDFEMIDGGFGKVAFAISNIDCRR